MSPLTTFHVSKRLTAYVWRSTTLDLCGHSGGETDAYSHTSTLHVLRTMDWCFFTHSSTLHYIHSYLLHTCWSYVYFMHSGLKKHWSHLLCGQMISSTYIAAFDSILSAQISFYNKSHPPVTHTLIAAFHTHSHTNRCPGSNTRFSIMPKIYWSTCRQPALPPDPQPFPKLKLI